ncbi:MAG: response regulator [Nitrososphaera sp.]
MRPRSGSAYRILVVDDEPDIIPVIRRYMLREGFLLDDFTDSELAVQQFKPDFYDLALLDIRMPKLNGFDLYRQLKMRDDNLKVCFLTAYELYFNDFRKTFPEIRISCFIKKPVELKMLAMSIRGTLDSAD